MASEDTGDTAGVSVSDDVRRWLQQRADEHGVDVDRFVQELLAAHATMDAASDRSDADSFAEIADQNDIDDLRTEFQDLLEDVRSRVIQVKRDADAKAPEEHDHDAIDAELDELHAEIDTLEGDLDAHREQLSSLEETVDGGFENYEAVLDYLVETTDDLADRTDRLARATIETRDRLHELAGTVEQRTAVDRLKRDAALEGITGAKCNDCGQTVRPALLTSPECPFCAATFTDVHPKSGLLGSATFETGEKPALTGTEEDPVAEELRSDVEQDRPDPANVDWDTAGDDDL